MKNVLAIILSLAFTSSFFAQNRVDIRLNPTHLSAFKSCFNLELRSLENDDILLAGQNYRIFYDPNKISFNTEQLSSSNPKEYYSDVRVLKRHHSDEISVAMINLGIDALKFHESRVTTLSSDTWHATSNVCFDHAENIEYTLTWAREDETADLATAYVSLSEWKSEKKQQNIHINEYFDYSHNRKIDDLFQSDFSVYPNPVMDEVNLQIHNFGALENGTLYIVDGAGKQIRKQEINKENSVYQIDMTRIPSGTYFMEVNDNKDQRVFQSSFVKSSL